MKVAVSISISDGSPWARVSVPNTFEYCFRHGYSLAVFYEQYKEALVSQGQIVDLLSRFDLVWCIDADVLITNHTKRIEEVEGLGPHCTVCEEGMPWLKWNRLNCGSMVYRATDKSREFLTAVREAEPEWRDNPTYPFVSQSWIAAHAESFGDALTILPPRAFNSVAWQQNGGGTTWQPGDLVFHPCCHPRELREEILRNKLPEVVR
jgi:hypothetical protein